MKYLYVIVLSFNVLAINTVRSEINRFRLLKDKSIIERELITKPHSSFLQMDLNISSSLKTFIGEIGSSTSKDSESEKKLGVTSVLSKYVNTEKFFDAFIETAIPLPYFKYQGMAFLPNIFANIYAGTSISINNQDNPLSPIAQVYLQKNINLGVSVEVKNENERDKIYNLALYKRSRSDLSAKKTATAIAEEEEIVSLDQIKKNQNDYIADIGVKIIKENKYYILEVKELKILDAGSEIDNVIGNAPLFHVSQTKEYNFEKFKMSLIYGLHHRQKYSLFDGAYIASSYDFTDKNPIKVLIKVDSHFISFVTGLSFSHFNFRYGYKTALTNPRDDMWVPAQHNIHINIPI